MVTVDLTHLTKEVDLRANVLCYVGNSIQVFIDMIEDYGGEPKLEEDMCFAVMFNTEPDIDKMEDYLSVVNRYPKSNRVLSEQIWIGNYSEYQHAGIVKQVLDNMFSYPTYTGIKYLK